MKRLACQVLLLAAAVPAQDARRVACIGAAGRNAWPAQLAWRLGDGFAVRAFAAGGPALRSWRPDVVVVIDSVAARAAKLRASNPGAEVWLCAPRRVAAKLRGAQATSKLRLVALDAVDRAPFGAARLADDLAELIRTPVDRDCDLRRGLEGLGFDVESRDFHGFAQLEFALAGGIACKLVAPHAVAYDRPWIWRARFFGHRPALDIALLDRGYHVLYCDIAGLYGGPKALARMDRAYGLARKLGLHPQPLLEGMSRGGLAVFNWAIENPGRVTAIYGDNPVLDFRSWPGKRRAAEWKQCLAAYGLDDARAAAYDRTPLDRTAVLGQRRMPVFLVVGQDDDVVPPARNALALAARLEDRRSPVKVWLKPGSGHHPHGLEPVGPLLRALLRAAGRATNPAVVPVPSVETRGEAAGWGGGTWWEQWGLLLEVVAANPKCTVVFLGDSITQGLTGAAQRLSVPGGKRAFDRFYGMREALGLGLSGDRTEHVLWRVEHGQLDRIAPKLVVLQIGVNNIAVAHHTGRETAAGTFAIVDAIRARLPETRILLLGCFPAGPSPDDPRRAEVTELHAVLSRRVAASEGGRLYYRDLRALFTDDDGKPNGRMARDAIHVTRAGQEAWLDAIEPLAEKVLGGQ